MLLRQTSRHQAKIAIILAIVLVLALNVFSAQFFRRFDLTANKDYSLSPATRGIAGKLKDQLTIKAYFSANLPGYLAASNQAVRDLLSEYEKAGRGKILLTYLDPSKDKALAQEANGLGIPPLQFNVVQKDKYEVMNGYLGLAVISGEKKEIIPLVDNASSLEYSLTAAISKVTRVKTPTVAFLSSSASAGAEPENLRAASELLSKQYFVRDFDAAFSPAAPNDIDVLIVPGRSAPFSKQEQYALDQFLMRGGQLAIFSSGVSVDLATLTAAKAGGGLDDLLNKWGVRLDKALILDVSNEMQGFRNNVMQFSTPYPFLVKIVKNGFANESGIVNKLEQAVFPFASPLEILSDKLSDKTKALPLARTTPQAWTQADNFILNPQGIPAPAAGAQKQFTVAAMLSGRFQSAFTPDTIPVQEGEKKVGPEDKKNFKPATEAGRLIVAASGDFISGESLRRWPGNAALFGNLVDALAGEEGLTSIRSKSSADRPLRQISDSARSAVKWGNILGMSVLFAAYGLTRSLRRRKGLIYD